MKWRGATDIGAVDAEFLRSALAAYISAARKLTTDGDRIVHPETGLPVDHLRVHSGVHLRPGVVYESVSSRSSPRAAAAARSHVTVDGRSVPVDDPIAQLHLKSLSPTATTSRALVCLEADSEQMLRLSGIDEEVSWHVEVERPGMPRKVAGCGRFDAGPGRWIGGEVTFDVATDLDRACAIGRRFRDVADFTAEHRRLLVDATVAARLDGDRIVLEMRAGCRGRGVARPVVAVALFVLGRRIKRMLDDGLADLDENLESLREDIASSASPDDLAHDMLMAMFEESSEPETAA